MYSTCTDIERKKPVQLLFENLMAFYSEKELVSHFSISTRAFRRILKSGRMTAGEIQLISLASKLSPCVFLENEKIDPEYVRNVWELRPYMNKKYKRGAYSRIGITKNILKILEETCGGELVLRVLSHLQVSKDFITSFCGNVSTEINSDIYKYLVLFENFSTDSLYNLGLLTLNKNRRTDFESLVQSSSVKKSYEVFLGGVCEYFEKSFNYKLMKLSNSHAVIHKELSPGIIEELGQKTYSNAYADDYALGFCATIPAFKTKIFSNAKKTKCLFENGNYTEYEIDFSVCK